MAESWEAPMERVEGKVNTLQAMLETHIDAEKERWEVQDKTNDAFQEKIDRPSWAVTVILSAMSSVCVGLIVYLATHMG